MKCSKCGANIRDGSLYCEVCGEEVRIVPDYNALDEVLTAHVRGEIEYTKNLQRGSGRTHESTERPRKRKKKQKNNVKQKMLIILGCMLAAMLIGFIIYRGSYSGLIQRGYNSLEKKAYTAAEEYFSSAAHRDAERADAYIGLSKVYIAQDDNVTAEELFVDLIREQRENAEIYKALAEFYIETEQVEKIPVLIDECKSDKVLNAMNDYYVAVPEFSVAEGTYDVEQKLTLKSGKNIIYYTLDESKPTIEKGTKYGTEIELDEGEWTVRAIAVNKRGVPSLEVEKVITIELPIADPPIVYPSTGLYESQKEITIQVEDGYTAYYAFDETNLTVENGKKYTGPIPMPEGNKLFSAILVDNATGKVSAVTVRNYDLQLNSEEESSEEE